MPDLLVKYHSIIPAPRNARRWIADTFAGQVERMLCGPSNVGAQRAALWRVLATGAGQAVVATPTGHPDDFSGWALGMGGALVFAYVRREFRRQGIGAVLIGAVTSDEGPVRTAYWTDDVDGMCKHGIPLCYDVRAYQALLSFVITTGQRKTKAAVAA